MTKKVKIGLEHYKTLESLYQLPSYNLLKKKLKTVEIMQNEVFETLVKTCKKASIEIKRMTFDYPVEPKYVTKKVEFEVNDLDVQSLKEVVSIVTDNAIADMRDFVFQEGDKHISYNSYQMHISSNVISNEDLLYTEYFDGFDLKDFTSNCKSTVKSKVIFTVSVYIG